MDEEEESTVIIKFAIWYSNYHGYVSLVVCIAGVVFNGFNVVVLTRKDMINSTNYFLTALALADFLTMLSCIPFAVQFHCLYGNERSLERNTYPWSVFLLVHVNFSMTTHTIAIWLAVVLSAFRYCQLQPSGECCLCMNAKGSSGTGGGAGGLNSGAANRLNETWRRTRIAVYLVCLCSVLTLVPNYATLVIEAQKDPDSNLTLYDVVTYVDLMEKSRNSSSHHHPNTTTNMSLDYLVYDSTVDETVGFLEVLTEANFWIQAFCVKLIPCALMVVWGFLLIRTMHASQKRRNQLLLASALPTGCSQIPQGENSKKDKPKKMSYLDSNRRKRLTSRQKDHNRTTAMLVIIVVLFLLTELPQGLLSLSVAINKDFFDRYYVPMGDLFDILALTNNGINFTLYCVMSRKFRVTFFKLFCGCVYNFWVKLRPDVHERSRLAPTV